MLEVCGASWGGRRGGGHAARVRQEAAAVDVVPHARVPLVKDGAAILPSPPVRLGTT